MTDHEEVTRMGTPKAISDDSRTASTHEAIRALKPCPFCGGTESVEIAQTGVFWVDCGSCRSEGPVFETEAEAIAGWNRAMRPMDGGWQDIATAPKGDRIQVVALRGGERTMAHRWGEVWLRDDDGCKCNPTHWMPLPDPPSLSQQGEDVIP